MQEPEIDRITGPGAADRCEPLFREHMQWVVEQSRSLYGIEIAGEDPEQAHRSFLAELPKLVGPRGRILTATLAGVDAGIGVLKPISPEVAEVKRMYVRPEARGRGVARALIEALLSEARSIGYRTVRLDSPGFMTAAHALYRSVGFGECEPYEGFEGGSYAAIDSRTWVFMAISLE